MKAGLSKLTLVSLLVVVALLCILSPRSAAVVFCPEDRSLMPMQTSLPWGAIGYLDNGCTATLIDPQHIAAAAHCFVNDDTGGWQPNLVFYPNFNPQRARHLAVPVDRAVVGSRVATGCPELVASDWGIAHLAKPVTGFATMSISPLTIVPWEVQSAGYARDSHFFKPGPPPPSGVSKMGGNVWWQPALIDPKCKIHKMEKDSLLVDCACVGGNSGSPIFYSAQGSYYLTGVIHGGPCFMGWHGWWPIPSLQVTPGSSVSVAARGPDNLDLFAVGQDGGVYTAAWDGKSWKGWWRVRDLQAQPGSHVAAVSRSANWLDIFVTGKDGRVWAAAWQPSFADGWHGWWPVASLVTTPGSPVSAAARGANNLDLFVVGPDGGVYTAAWDGKSWRGWWRVRDLQAPSRAHVAVASRSADKLDIFVSGSDGRVHTAAWQPAFTDGWHGWWKIGDLPVKPGSPVSVACMAPDRMDVFVAGQDGGVRTAAWQPSFPKGWSGWARIGELQVAPGSHVGAVAKNANKLDVFVTNQDGFVCTASWESTFTDGWHGWCNILSLRTASGAWLGAVSRSTGWLDLFVGDSAGVVQAAAWNPTFSCENVSGPAPLPDRLNLAPSAKRFQYAPRFARNVAVARYVDGTARTQVFATDLDSNAVVTRYRTGSHVDDGFSTFESLGAVAAPRRIAAFLQTNRKPQLAVTSDDGKLYTRAVQPTGSSWGAWTTMDSPPGVQGFLDVDAAYDAQNTSQLYVIGGDQKVYTRGRVNTQPDAAWSPWQKMTVSGAYQKLTAVRRADGSQQLFLIASKGGVSTMWQTQASPTAMWTPPSDFGSPPAAAIADIDAGWTEDETVQVFAVDKDEKLWTRTMVAKDPSKGWGEWKSWPTTLYAPSVQNPQPPPAGIDSLTASRWQEETTGDIVPVVFATDTQGNIYFTSHTRAKGWEPWHSFYQ